MSVAVDNERITIETPSVSALVASGGGATVSDQVLVEWVGAELFRVTSVTRDDDGVVTSADVEWPDASAGLFTTTTKNVTWLAIDAFTVSHADSGKTVTQSAVTRDANGNVTAQAAASVA